MKELTIFKNENKETRINSIELVEIINQFRQLESETTEKDYKELQHKSFMGKIRNELEALKLLGLDNQQNILLVEYEDKKGEKRPCYSLNRDGMLQMLNSESALVRFKTIEYINSLEDELNIQRKLPSTFKEALIMLVEAEEEKERLLLENETISLEKRLLSGEVFSWANRSLINALVRRYANGDFGVAWKEYKKNLLYSHSININSRITNYLNKTGKRTKPKTLDMLDDSEVPNAIATIISMCNEENIDISDIIKHYKDGESKAS